VRAFVYYCGLGLPFDLQGISRERWVVKISVLLEEALADRFERYCRGHGYKKSTLIARLIREHLEIEQFAVQTEIPLEPTKRAPKNKSGPT
jgi:hypothetical protein